MQVSIKDFDDLQAKLRDRVFQEYGGAAAGSDFQAIVATPDSSIGTLIRAGGSLPADSSDCIPTPLPKPVPHGGLFPEYNLSSSTAISANLGPNAVQALSSSDLNLGSSSTLTYKIDDPQIQIIADNTVEGLTRTGNCHDYIQAHPGLRFIRGMVTGKITYIVHSDHPASAKAQLLKDFGKISVADDPGNSTLSISDAESQPIVDLLTIFPAAVTTAAAATMETMAMNHALNHHNYQSGGNAAFSPPATSPDRAPASVAGPRVYVQADVLEPAASSASVVQQLAAAWPSAMIIPRVERVPSARMPTVAQVRFFNDGDQALAQNCLAILKEKYPNARIVRIGLSSPAGQLEVWLPKFTGQP
jgi:hypothetical protein